MSSDTARPNSMRKRVRTANRMIGAILICAAWTRIFVRPRVEGREHLKQDGPLILAVNHLSFFDIPALAGLISRYRRDVTFLAMAELFANFLVRRVLLWFGIIPVYRGTERATEASDQGVIVLRHGGVVITFIEGRISRDGKLQRARNGVAYMALMAGALVIPVALAGTERVKRLGTGPLHWGWGRRYAVVVGPGIRVERNINATAQDRQMLTDQIMGSISTQHDRALALAA